MTLSVDNFLLVGSVLMLVSILASKTSFRLGVPVLILFLAIGMLAGSEGIGRIQFDDPKVAKFVGIIGLNFILFSGGFGTQWSTIRPVLREGIALSTIGVVLTAGLLGLFVHLVANFTLAEGLLLGAVISSTDAAAVFSILRSKNMALKHHIRPLLELESGSNDPMAFVLTVAMIAFLTHPGGGPREFAILLLRQIAIGAMAGLLLGWLSARMINLIRLNFEGLYPILLVAIMFLTFTVTDGLEGNGYLAVYLCAVYLGNQELIYKDSIAKTFDGFAWLMQIVLFLTLGLLVFPSRLLSVFGIALAVSAFLMLVVRPLAVFGTLAFFKVPARSKWFISWVGLKGAVPIVFATYPLIAGVEKAGMIFNIVFFVSLTSVLLQGTTLAWFAKRLRLIDKPSTRGISDHVILCGFGSIGTAVANSLREKGIPYVGIDLDPETVDGARQMKMNCFYGDGTSREVMAELAVHRARLVVITAPDANINEAIIRVVKAINPDCPVLSRSRHGREFDRQYEAGADVVVQEEFEAGLALLQHCLVRLGGDEAEASRETALLRKERDELTRSSHFGQVNLSRKLSDSRVNLNLKATRKEDAILELTKMLESSSGMSDSGGFYEFVLGKERVTSSGIGEGIALPHGRCESLSSVSLCLGVSRAGIKWGSIDKKPVHLIVLIAAGMDMGEAHLETISAVARVFGDAAFRSKLLAARSPEGVLKLISDRERELKARKMKALAASTAA